MVVNNPALDEEEPYHSYTLMEQRLAEQNRELATLLSVHQAITSRLHWQEVLQMIADGARRLINSLHAGVYLLEGDMLRLAVLSLDPTVVQKTNISTGYTIPLKQSIARLAFEAGKPILIPDVHNDPRIYQDILKRTPIRSYLAVPLMTRNQPFGVLFASDKQNGMLTTNDERILNLLASSAVIGLENARLYEQAEESAALAERSRLARELHDAVTQTLFSASLIAEVLPQIWENDPDEGRRRLQELRQSTRGALAEMRTLLLELRPTALIETEWGELFKHLVNAFTGRTRIPVLICIDGTFPMPGDVKVSLYRIAQEALNNIAHHSNANQVMLNLNCLPEQVTLEITDDGVGFDPSEGSAEHLGLQIMKERAAAIGADFTIQSSLGVGTTVCVQWKTEEAGR